MTGSAPTPARSWLPAAAAVALLVLVAASWWFTRFGPGGDPTFVDLDYYRAAAATALAGQPLYAALPYPPIALLVIAPLGGLPVLVGNQLWTVATLVVAAGLAGLVTRRAMVARGMDADLRSPTFVMYAAVAAALLLITEPMLSQLNSGQMTLFVAALALIDIAKVLPRRWQGACVGLAGAIKLLPLIFVPYYLVTGQRRQAAVATGTFAAVTAVGFLLFPADSIVFWTHLGRNDQFGDPARPDNLSIQAFVHRWLPALGSVSAVWLGIALVVAIAALVHARRLHRRGGEFSAALTVGAAAVVLSPISWPHYHVWLPLAAIWLVVGARQRRDRLVGIGLYLAYLAVVLALIDRATGGSLVVLDLLVLVPVLVGLLGLPLIPDRPSVAAAPADASSVDPVETA